MDRKRLTDGQRARMQPHCRGKVADPGRTGGDDRWFHAAVLWNEGARATGSIPADEARCRHPSLPKP